MDGARRPCRGTRPLPKIAAESERRAGIGGASRRGNLANNRRAIVELPGGAGEVSTDLPTRLIEKVCFEYPVEAAVLLRRKSGCRLPQPRAEVRSPEAVLLSSRQHEWQSGDGDQNRRAENNHNVPHRVSDCRRMALSGPFNRAERAEKVYNPSHPVR